LSASETARAVRLPGPVDADDPRFERERLYDAGRFPNAVVAVDGTVLATWGRERVRVRRSEDGGETWGPPVGIAGGRHGGGAVVDETTGDVLAFVGQDPRERDAPMYRSADHGATWTPRRPEIREDANGNVPSLHMSEHGGTLRRGPHAGRLLRPARVYGNRGYNTAVYSDDGGATWHASAPFPGRGTGEGAIVELADGELYYSSRKHHFVDPPYRHERLHARSDDGGETWRDPAYDEILPDGPRYRGEAGRGACYNGHFGMMGGLARLPVDDEDVLVYSNADAPGHRRRRLTVWCSFDGGATWPVKRPVDDRGSAYSSLAAGRPGTASEGWIYLLYERGTLPDDPDRTIEYGGGAVARFTLAWLVRGRPTGDGDPPGRATA